MEGKAQEVIKIGPDLIKKVLPEEVTFEMKSKVSRKYSLLTGMAYKAVSRCQKPGAGERLVSSGLKESHCEWSREDKGESVQHEPGEAGRSRPCRTSLAKLIIVVLILRALGRHWMALI